MVTRLKNSNYSNSSINSEKTDDSIVKGEGIDKIISLTQSEYDAISVPSNNALYYRNDGMGFDTGNLSQVAYSGNYNDINDIPALGTAAESNIEDFASTIHGHDIATGTESGFLSSNDKEKLDTVAENATQNMSDADLLNRENHNGDINIENVTGLQNQLDNKVSGNFEIEILSESDYENLPEKNENKIYYII